MAQRPFQTGAVVNLSDGESIKETVLVTVPRKKRFHTQYLGINGFGHPNQSLFYAVHVTTRSRVGIYPIAPAGTAEIDEPEFPVRYFGSQVTILYADPGSNLIFSVARKNTKGSVRVMIDICGLLVDV
ncbi:MAG TPA: hypothetical protein VLE46_12915 [Nitrospira sp.]|jgi:hypothetical protein|nr:hypothetical protein [Nitrospira sp.]